MRRRRDRNLRFALRLSRNLTYKKINGVSPLIIAKYARKRNIINQSIFRFTLISHIYKLL